MSRFTRQCRRARLLLLACYRSYLAASSQRVGSPAIPAEQFVMLGCTVLLLIGSPAHSLHWLPDFVEGFWVACWYRRRFQLPQLGTKTRNRKRSFSMPEVGPPQSRSLGPCRRSPRSPGLRNRSSAVALDPVAEQELLAPWQLVERRDQPHEEPKRRFERRPGFLGRISGDVRLRSVEGHPVPASRGKEAEIEEVRASWRLENRDCRHGPPGTTRSLWFAARASTW